MVMARLFSLAFVVTAWLPENPFPSSYSGQEENFKGKELIIKCLKSRDYEFSCSENSRMVNFLTKTSA